MSRSVSSHRSFGGPFGASPGFGVLAASVLGSAMTFMDGSIVNVALPAIGADLSADVAALQWIVTGYMLALASLMLIGGALGDRWGSGRAFVAGVCGFAAASALCALAPSAVTLVAARIVQGIAAALLVPSSLAIIAATFKGAARGRAIGTWAAASAVGTAIGPVVGGWLVDTANWRAVFAINLPLAIAALFFARGFPPLPRTPGGRLDWPGAVTGMAALGLLNFGLIAIGDGRYAVGAAAIVAAFFAGAGFLRCEHRAANPMIPLDLFAEPGFAAINLLTVLLYAGLSACFVVLPLSLIAGHGYDAVVTGTAFVPFSVLMGGFSRFSGGLAARTGPRLPLVLGPATAAAGFLLLAFSVAGGAYWLDYFPGIVAVGIGMTITVPVLTTAVLDAVADTRTGTASSINNVAARAGGLVAIAAIGLAFGGRPGAIGDPDLIILATRRVLFAAAAIAALSAVTALALAPRRNDAA
ncbi:MFS transporter [Pararhizobium mangrovi]|uniref:MFS transporter n=1 Tax=Pararhizobium mangrovi TaxID=2590452 RepID=A0A506U9A7_9HYPH|nr:MFS transporter [Pararhizobium mangrovi]TPW29946.1 MFS transporter [Pararhizobium mangrovi]